MVMRNAICIMQLNTGRFTHFISDWAKQTEINCTESSDFIYKLLQFKQS